MKRDVFEDIIYSSKKGMKIGLKIMKVYILCKVYIKTSWHLCSSYSVLEETKARTFID